MRRSYKCPKGCKLPPRRKELRENKDHTYSFGYRDLPFCPVCGSLMPGSLEKLKGFFEVYNIHPSLQNSVDLMYKSEFQSAAREAFITLENALRKKSGLDLHGFDLATKALNFEYDRKNEKVIKQPLIVINKLESESDRNEQEGIRYMLMGFFQGPRNLYLHNHIGSGVSNSISVIIEASFFLHILDGNSLTKNGKWVPVKTDFNEIYDKMPRRIDRWQLKRILKRRRRMLKRNKLAEQKRLFAELEETIDRIRGLE